MRSQLRRLRADERGAVEVGTRAEVHRKEKTLRRDTWWIQPAITAGVLGAFVIYATWAAFVGKNYYVEPYLSPFYSPCIAEICDHATFVIIGRWWPLSPALLILPFPLAFRLTCYYYRKAYYRSFWLSPPACAVTEPHKKYTGETRLPLILQNIHRYAFYAALPFPIILAYDTVLATQFRDGFGVGLGTVVLGLNAVLLGLYTLSCHSCRHLFGGHVDRFSKARARFWSWRAITRLNYRHMPLAWVSLVWVALADVYVRLVATGVINDPRLF